MFLVEARMSLELSETYNKNQKFTETEDMILAHGMFKNFILSYAKCFASSGKGKITLDSNEIFSLRKDLKTIHDKIISIRNTYVAHNDDNDYDITISLTKENEHEIILAQTYTVITPLSDFRSFKEALDYCEEQVIMKFNKKVDKIQAKIGKCINFE